MSLMVDVNGGLASPYFPLCFPIPFSFKVLLIGVKNGFLFVIIRNNLRALFTVYRYSFSEILFPFWQGVGLSSAGPRGQPETLRLNQSLLDISGHACTLRLKSTTVYISRGTQQKQLFFQFYWFN